MSNIFLQFIRCYLKKRSELDYIRKYNLDRYLWYINTITIYSIFDLRGHQVGLYVHNLFLWLRSSWSIYIRKLQHSAARSLETLDHSSSSVFIGVSVNLLEEIVHRVSFFFFCEFFFNVFINFIPVSFNLKL